MKDVDIDPSNKMLKLLKQSDYDDVVPGLADSTLELPKQLGSGRLKFRISFTTKT